MIPCICSYSKLARLLFFILIPFHLFSQSNSIIDGLEIGYSQRNTKLSITPYSDYYSKFYYQSELVNPDSLIKEAESKGESTKNLLTLSFYRDSLFIIDTVKHRFDRFKIGIGAGRSKNSYYTLTTKGLSDDQDSIYNYAVFEDLFRLVAEYQLITRTHKRIQYYYGFGTYIDLKIGSILAKDGIRNFVYDSQLKVLVKKSPDIGMNIPLGLRFKLAKNTYFHYELRLGAELNKDHMNQSRILFTRGFNFNLSIAIR